MPGRAQAREAASKAACWKTSRPRRFSGASGSGSPAMADHDACGPAIALITRVLARARADGADDEVTARHILTALLGAGWRRVIEPPPPPGGPAVPPTAEFLAARAAIQPLDGER